MEEWDAVLDEMERRLAEAEAEVEAGASALGSGAGAGGGALSGYVRFDPVAIPSSLGPLPPECRERAEAVYIATVEMEGRVSAAMATIASQIRRRALVADTRPAPAYVDQAL